MVFDFGTSDMSSEDFVSAESFVRFLVCIRFPHPLLCFLRGIVLCVNRMYASSTGMGFASLGSVWHPPKGVLCGQQLRLASADKCSASIVVLLSFDKIVFSTG